MIVKGLILLYVFVSNVLCEECQKNYLFCGQNDPVKCVPSEWWCDGHPDCDSGKDEENCPVTICRENEIQCKSGTQCIPKFLRCDGEPHCIDGSDEHNCVNISSKMCDLLTQFDCNGDGHECIPIEKVCDDHSDCDGHNDEMPGGSKNHCQRNDCRLTPNGGCSHLCINRHTSIICHCPVGHRLLTDRKTCTDIDECSLKPQRCSQICNNTVGGYQCSCHSGYKLNPKQPNECIVASGDRMLLVALESGEIVTFDLDSDTNTVHNVSSQTNSWLNIDMDMGTGSDTTIYWSTLKNNNIGRTVVKRKSGSPDVLEVISQTQLFKLTNGSFCAGLSFDWLRSLLFWTTTEEAHIYVTNTTSNKTSIILKDDLENPRSIVADPFEARLYWIDWGTKSSFPRIETMLMNGRDRRVFIKSGLRQPQGIAIDFLDRRLYWADIKPGSIVYIDLNKPWKTETVISNKLLHPFSVSLFESRVFWSDWRQNQIISVGKTVGDNMKIVGKISKPMSIIVLNRLNKPQIDSTKLQIHTCLNKLPHSCSDICLPSPPANDRMNAIVKCVCPIGTLNSFDKLTCTTGVGTLFMPNNVNRYKIIIAVLISLVVIIGISMIIIFLYLCRSRLCSTRSLKTMSRHGINHPIVTGDLMYIFKCHSHSSQLSELLSSDINSVSNA